jgi:hypothetical protein
MLAFHRGTICMESELCVMGCTRGRNVERGTKGLRVRKTGLSSTLIKLRYEQRLQVSYLS